MNSVQSVLYIGADHGGFQLKEQIKIYLGNAHPDFAIVDVGAFDEGSVDYPDIANRVCNGMHNDPGSVGIICCGTGIGVGMMANRHKGIRAAVVHDLATATLAKEHNNANVLCLGGRTTRPEIAEPMVTAWLRASFGGDRHMRRIAKFDLPL